MQWRACITGPFRATWVEGESLAMRYILVAGIVVLSSGCGLENPSRTIASVFSAIEVSGR